MIESINHLDYNFDYDLIVIGGGSGGLIAAKEAAKLGANVCLFDYVEPSPKGTSWGLGGTCVNVGCIPKKLMHQAGLIAEGFADITSYGWNLDKNSMTHNWETLVDNVSQHINSLNWNYRTSLRTNKVTYLNALASFKNHKTVKYIDQESGNDKYLTAKHFIIAIGGRPRYPDIPGIELAITSDDIFRLEHPPGKTLVVGASYVALECGGFLGSLGYDTTIMIRSIPLRGFDQDMAEKVVAYVDDNNICSFIRDSVPMSLEKTDDEKILVKYCSSKGNDNTNNDKEDKEEVYDTVLFAIGRQIQSEGLSLNGLKTDPSNGKIFVNNNYQTNIDNIYVIGDAIRDSLELTPVAIKEGISLARQLFQDNDNDNNHNNHNNHNNQLIANHVPSAVFTPLEYGFVGLSRLEADLQYGSENYETYHTYFTPLEWKVTERNTNSCYCKILVVKQTDLVIGLHILSPNSGEIVSGFSLALNLGLTRSNLIDSLAIHPTISEELFKLEISKSSGIIPLDSGC